MTLEPEGGYSTTVPAWVYWVMTGLSAGLPVLVASDLLPGIVRLFLAALNAGIAICVGVSQPLRSAKALETARLARERGAILGAGRIGGKPRSERYT